MARVYLRTRLTIGLVVVVAMILGTFSIAIFQSTRGGVLSEIQRDVHSRAAGIAASIERSGDIRATDVDVFTTPDTYVQLVEPDGRIIDRSSNLQGRRLPMHRAEFDNGEVVEVRVDDVPVYLGGARVRSDGETAMYVLVGRSPGPMYKVLHRLRRVLVPGAIVVLVLTGGLVWLVVRRSFSRLVRLGDAAERIAHSQDHTDRVGARGPRDEIRRVATAIDRMLEALEDAHRQVRETNEAQRTFLADVSHELRAPLTVMLSSLELLQRVGSSDPDFRDRVLADLHAEASRIARMVTQLLVMARTGDGASAGDRPVLFAEILGECCRQWEVAGGAVRLEWSNDGLEDTVVQANEDYLRQVLHILLDNAFKFTPNGGRVCVDGEQRNGTVRVTVVDTGNGIAAEDLARIFDRFYRGRNAHGDGTGLGLAIARHIARRYGGDVTVSSEPGSGSRFTVELPIVED